MKVAMLGESVLARPLVYVELGRRAPRKGEYFLSGAIPTIYRAPNDLGQEHLIVRPTHYAKRVQRFEMGEPFTG